MAQWRIELRTEDVVELSRGLEIVVTAIDEEHDLASSSTDGGSIEVAIALLDV
jgi:PII-like signaling protein